jgi:RimJ/RimL family protein N-acetyltransferase
MTPDVQFRPLSRTNFPLLQTWLARPHVDAWWHDARDLAGVEAKYGPRVDGTDPTRTFVVETGNRPVGWVQWHYWRDYMAHGNQLGATIHDAGLDLAIGEPEFIGRGLGPAIIRAAVEQLIFVDPGVISCIADPEDKNSASLKAFEKAGFVLGSAVQLDGEDCIRRVVRRER